VGYERSVVVNKLLILLGIIFLTCFPLAQAQAQAKSDPEQSDNGIYIKKYAIKGADKKFYYAADPITQECFSIVRIGLGAGYTTVPCKKLKKRPEWKGIIFWN